MDVVDHRMERPGFLDVPVVSASGLPEAAFRSYASSYRDPGEPLRGMHLKALDGPPADRLFDRFEDRADVIVIPARVEDQVNVFRHKDVSPQGEIQPLPPSIDGFGEPLARPL
jgi:hypothetical protein